MDTFSMFKFWKTNKSKVAVDRDAAEGDGDGDGDVDTVVDSTFSDPITEFSDDDDDSFFELELTLPKFNTNSTQTNLNSEKSEPKVTSKPQSPISILRSASPKLRIFMFGKMNRKSKSGEDTFCDNESVSSCFSPKSNSSSAPFTVKFKIEDGSFVPTQVERRSFEDSRRFSKDVMQKYLNLVKPLYSKKSNTESGGDRIDASCSPSRTSSASFPSPIKEKSSSTSTAASRFKAKTKTKRLGKSKSASAMIVSPSMPKNDHPCDGIEGAILHCKRSLNNSTAIGHSSLSRCSSDPSHEKSITLSEDKL